MSVKQVGLTGAKDIFFFLLFSLKKQIKISLYFFFNLQSARFWLVIATASFGASPWALALQK